VGLPGVVPLSAAPSFGASLSRSPLVAPIVRSTASTVVRTSTSSRSPSAIVERPTSRSPVASAMVCRRLPCASSTSARIFSRSEAIVAGSPSTTRLARSALSASEVVAASASRTSARDRIPFTTSSTFQLRIIGARLDIQKVRSPSMRAFSATSTTSLIGARSPPPLRTSCSTTAPAAATSSKRTKAR